MNFGIRPAKLTSEPLLRTTDPFRLACSSVFHLMPIKVVENSSDMKMKGTFDDLAKNACSKRSRVTIIENISILLLELIGWVCTSRWMSSIGC